MKTKKMRKLMSLVVAMILTFSLCIMNVSAAEETDPPAGNGFQPGRTTGSLLLKKHDDSKEESVYSIYKIMDATVKGESTVYTYSYREEYKEFLTENPDFTLDKITNKEKPLPHGAPNYTIIPNSADQLAASLMEYIEGKETDPIQPVRNDIKAEKKVEGLELGYYLVVENLIDGKPANQSGARMKPMLVAIPSQSEDGYDYEVVITLKDRKLTLEKTVGEVDQNLVDKSKAQQIGKEYEYQIVQDIPKYDTSVYKDVVFKITDTMDKGLEFIDDDTKKTVKVYKRKAGENDELLTKETNYTIKKIGSSSEETGTEIEFDFSGDKYNKIADADQIVIKYQARITKDAEFTPSGEPNKVITTVGPKTNSTHEGTPEYAIVYSAGIEITKVDEADEPLEGAEFTVYTNLECTEEAPLATYKLNDEGEITTTVSDNLSASVEVDANGIARFSGLGEGEYWIKETQVPGGYVGLENPIYVKVTAILPEEVTTGEETVSFKFEVDLDGELNETGERVFELVQETTDNTVNIGFKVKNTPGFTLPTTGGMGTYLFTIGGAVLILAAAILFIRSRRKVS